MIQIMPTLLATTEDQYQKCVEQIEKSRLFEDGWVQIDLMDNKFVQNKSIGIDTVAKFPLNSRLEAQLMVEDPGLWLDRLKELNFSRVIFPLEIGDTTKWINRIKSMGFQVGISLNPESSTKELEAYLNDLDSVLVMGVNPGFQGQTLIPETIGKIEELAKSKNGRKYIIGVDGGVTPENAKMLVNAGVDYLAIGSKLFNGSIIHNVERFWEVLNG